MWPLLDQSVYTTHRAIMIGSRTATQTGSVRAKPSTSADIGGKVVKFVEYKSGTAGWHTCYHMK